MLHPYKISTGSIVSGELHKKYTHASKVEQQQIHKQLDSIIWSSTPNPAIFEEGEFALVHYQSVSGVLEVKRSLYSGVDDKLRETLDWVESISVSDRKDQKWNCLAVVCLQQQDQKVSQKMKELIADGRAVILLHEMANGTIKTNVSHVLHLIVFLAECKKRAAKNLETYSLLPQEIGTALGEDAPGSLKK